MARRQQQQQPDDFEVWQPEQALSAPVQQPDDFEPWEPAPQAQAQQPDDFVPWEPEPQQPEAEGMIGTALRSAAHAVLPSATGLAGIPLGIAGGAAAFGLPTGGLGALPGAIVGGIGAYAAGSKAQETALQAMGFDDSQQQAVNAKTNPKSALAGEILGALPTVGVGAGIKAITRLGGALGGGLLEAGSQALGDEFWDPTRIGGAAVAGGLLAKPTRLGEAIGSGTAKAIGRPELWHGAVAPDAGGTSKEQPPPRPTPDAGAELPTDYYAKPPRVTEIEPSAGPEYYTIKDPLGARTDGETLGVQVIRRNGEITALVPGGGAPVDVAPAYRGLSAEEAIAHTFGDHPQGAAPDTAKVQRIESPQIGAGPRVIEGEAPAAAPQPQVTPVDLAIDAAVNKRPVEPQVTEVEPPTKYGPALDREFPRVTEMPETAPPIVSEPPATPREAMAQRAPGETVGDRIKQFIADERGGGRIPPRKPPTEEPGAGPVAKAADAETLPKELAGAKPRYAYGSKQFQPEFASDIDKALFITAQTKKSTSDAKYRDWLTKQGFSDEDIGRLGQQVRNEIKVQAAGAPEGGRLFIDPIARKSAPPSEAMPTPGVIEGKTIPGAKARADAALTARGFTPEQIVAMTPKAKEAILQKRQGEVGSEPPEAAPTAPLPGRPAEMSPVGGDAPPAVTPTAAPPGKPPKPPTVGEAAAAAGGTPPPAGPTSMVYVPPSKRSDLSELVRNMKLLVGGDIGPIGRMATELIRKSYGNLNREYEQGQNLLDRHRETIANISEQDRWKLINRIEGGNQYAGWQPTPEQRTLINDHKSVMDAWKSQLQGLDRTAQMKFADDYLVHMYENPDQAREFFNNWGKRGGAGSTKARKFPTYQDAIDAGLKPLTSDPIELAQRYGLSMKHFIASNDVIERAVSTGVAGYFKAGKAIGASGSPSPLQVGGPPPGWQRLNAPPNKQGHELYAPEDFAAKYNKFYERGYFGGAHAPIYNAIRQSNSAWTQLELGLNAYHFFTMANEAIISDVARGFDKIFSGQFRSGLQSIAQSPLAPRTRYVEGKRFQQEYLNPNSTNPVASIVAEANARPIGKGHALDVLGTPGDPTVPVRGAFIKNFSPENINFEFRKAWDEVKQDWGASQGIGEVVKFPFKQASRAIQTVSAPLFDKYIPALKAGAVHSQMEAWFEANPHIDPHNMTSEQRTSAVQAATKIVDSTDNRFGEMIHDNLFMNKTLQQSAIVSMRSFSWTLGAMREIAGGTAAGAKAFSALGRGENKFSMAHPEYDPRIAYTLALPFVVATTSAIYQFLRTGELPEDVRDLYAPKTGGTIPGLGGKGEVKEHVLMPGFHKDVYGWLAHPLREAYAKSSGLTSTAYEQLTNEDWRGDPIYKRGADPIEHMQQRASHLFSRLGPISIRNMVKGQPETSGISPIETSLGFRAPGANIQDPTQLENWMRVKSEREWEAKQRHARTEAKKYEPQAAAGGQ